MSEPPKPRYSATTFAALQIDRFVSGLPEEVRNRALEFVWFHYVGSNYDWKPQRCGHYQRKAKKR